MKKLTTFAVHSDDTVHATFVSLMTVFGTTLQQLKDRVRIERVDGLGALHLKLLCLCVEQPGCTQQQLANLTGRDKGQVAHLIHALEARGLVVRAPDAQDGRLLRTSLTAAGAKEVQRFVALETDLAHQLFSKLNNGEVEQFQALAEKLQQRSG